MRFSTFKCIVLLVPSLGSTEVIANAVDIKGCVQVTPAEKIKAFVLGDVRADYLCLPEYLVAYAAGLESTYYFNKLVDDRSFRSQSKKVMDSLANSELSVGGLRFATIPHSFNYFSLKKKDLNATKFGGGEGGPAGIPLPGYSTVGGRK